MLRGTLLTVYCTIIQFVVCLPCLVYGQNDPYTVSTSSRELSFNFSDFKVGSAEYKEGPTGCTVFYFPNGAKASVDIRGGSVGSFFTQEKMQNGDAQIDAITFSGGGILGLEATTGVVSSLFKQSKKSDFQKMPLVSGAVIYDFLPRPKSTIYPDKTLGQKALQQAKENHFLIGPHGAGISATFGKSTLKDYIPSGQGAAFKQIGKTKIAVFTVVNSIGHILDENGQVVVGVNQRETLQQFQSKIEQKLNNISQSNSKELEGNTTLTLVVINQQLSARHLQQLGRQVHHALSQVIYPYGTILDGDVLYIVSTQTQNSGLEHTGCDIQNDLDPNIIYLGMVASDLAKQAVWSILPIEEKSH